MVLTVDRDANVQNLAEEVEKVATMIQREEPAWYEQHVGA
jgi:COP9 signalosome complex subunit 4